MIIVGVCKEIRNKIQNNSFVRKDVIVQVISFRKYLERFVVHNKKCA